MSLHVFPEGNKPRKLFKELEAERENGIHVTLKYFYNTESVLLTRDNFCQSRNSCTYMFAHRFI